MIFFITFVLEWLEDGSMVVLVMITSTDIRRITESSSQNARVWSPIPTRAQRGLVISHTLLNTFADVCGGR